MPRHADPDHHATHDLELIAAFAAGDAVDAELEAATALVAACATCAALHHDLRAIAAALPLLPAPVRQRDFRLTETQAAALRPGGWRRLVGVLAGPRFSFAAPLGTGLATLGIAVVLLSSNLGLPFATGGATTAERAASGDAFAVQSPLPSAASELNGPGAAASPVVVPAAPTTKPAADAASPAAPPADAGTDTSSGDGTGAGNAGGNGQAEGAPTPGAKSLTGGDLGAQSGIDRGDVPSIVGIAAILLGLGLVLLRVLIRRLA